MNQYKMNKFLLSLLVFALTCVSTLLVYFYLDVELYEYILIGVFGLLGLLGIQMGIMRALLGAFFVTLSYGVLVIISGTTDYLEAIGISYIYLLLPMTITVITGFFGQLNGKYLRVADSFEEDYEVLVRIDGLTGFRNRIDYFENLTEEINRKVRYKQHLTVMLLQMDSLKEINELYGYSQGEKFLKYLSEFVIELTRNVDKHYRISDNLFALILPNTDAAGAIILKNRFLDEFQSMNIVVRTNNQIIDMDIDIVYEEYKQDGINAIDFHRIAVDQLAIKPRGEYV